MLTNSLVPLGVRVSARRIIFKALYMCETGFWIFKVGNIPMNFEYTYYVLNVHSNTCNNYNATTHVYNIANIWSIFYRTIAIWGVHSKIPSMIAIIVMYNLTILNQGLGLYIFLPSLVWWNVACSAPSHYLSQRLLMVILIPYNEQHNSDI